MKIWDALNRIYRNVDLTDRFYSENGNKLYRIETKGKTGKTLYANGYYIFSNKESSVSGSGGSTGHGWGGRVCGYIPESDFNKFNIKH